MVGMVINQVFIGFIFGKHGTCMVNKWSIGLTCIVGYGTWMNMVITFMVDSNDI